MKNWRTSAIGIGAGVAYLAYKILSGQPLTPQDFILAAGIAGGGIAAKDASVHSTVGEVQTATTMQQAADIKAANR